MTFIAAGLGLNLLENIRDGHTTENHHPGLSALQRRVDEFRMISGDDKGLETTIIIWQ